jgi:hypothetical protein
MNLSDLRTPAARSFQMLVEIASRMSGRGVAHETRRDVSSRAAPRRMPAPCARARAYPRPCRQ